MKNEFEKLLKDVYQHEEQAPNLMAAIHARRTPLYVFRNKLVINRWRVAGVLSSLILLGYLICQWAAPVPGELADNSGLTTAETGKASVKGGLDPAEKSRMLGEVTGLEEATTELNQARSSATGTQLQAVREQNNRSRRVPGQNIYDIAAATFAAGQDDGDGQGIENAGIVEEINQKPDENSGKDALGVNESTSHPAVSKQNDETRKTQSVPSNDNTADKPTTVNADADDNRSGEDILPNSHPISRWSLSAAYGPSRAFRLLESASDPQLASLRNESETPRYSQMAMIAAHYELHPNLEAYAGLQWLNRREAMSFTKTHTEEHMKINSREVVVVHPVEPPKTITVYDTAYSKVIVDESIENKNTYNHVSIPLGLRFSLYHNKIGLHIAGEGSIRLMSLARGTVMNADLSQEDLASENFRRTSLGYGIGAGLGFSYLFDPRFTAMVEPIRMTYFKSPTNNTRYALNQLDYGYSLMFSLKYHF